MASQEEKGRDIPRDAVACSGWIWDNNSDDDSLPNGLIEALWQPDDGDIIFCPF